MLKKLTSIFVGVKYSAIFLRGFLGLFSAQSISFLITLWSIKLCVQVYGEAYGSWIAGYALLSLASLLELGVGPFLVRELTKLRINNATSQERSTLIWTVFAVYGGLFFLISGIGFVISPLIADFVHSGSRADNLISTLRLASIYIALMQPLGIWRSLIHSDQKLATLGILNIIDVVAYAATLTVLTVWSNDLRIIPVSLLAGGIIAALASFSFLSTSTRKDFFMIMKPDGRLLARLFTYCKSMIALKTCFFIKERTDEPIAAKFLGGEMVLIYTITQKLVRSIPMMIIGNMAALSFTSISEVIARNQKEDLKRVVLQTLKWLIIMATISAATIWTVNPLFVNAWVGADRFGGDTLSLVFALWIFTEVFTKSFGILLHAADHQAEVAVSQFIEAVLNILLSLILVKIFGLVGIALGTLIACSVSSVYLTYRTFRLLFEVYWSDFAELISLQNVFITALLVVLITGSRIFLSAQPPLLQFLVPLALSGIGVMFLLKQEQLLRPRQSV